MPWRLVEYESLQFHLADVLAVTTGYPLSPTGMLGVRTLLSYLHKGPLDPHQVERASEDAKPFIFEQYPELEGVEPAKDYKGTPQAWVDEQVMKFGEYRTLRPIPGAEMLHRETVRELVEKLVRERFGGCVGVIVAEVHEERSDDGDNGKEKDNRDDG